MKKDVLDEEIMYLAGLVASDGCVKYRGKGCSVQYTNSEPALIKCFSEITHSIFGVWPKKYVVKPSYSKSGIV